MNIAKKTCLFVVATFSAATVRATTIGVSSGDFTLDASWSGGTAPGASDTADFAVDQAYGPFTMSKDMTVWSLSSGGWGKFTDTPQAFDLKGHTLTLMRSNSGYAFSPCTGGPRNHIEFSNGTIAFSGGDYFTIGYNPGSYSGSWLKLSGMTMTGATGMSIGCGDSGNHNCEVKIEDKSSVSIAGAISVSPNGLASGGEQPNRLIVDGGSAVNATGSLTMGGGGLLEVKDGSATGLTSFNHGNGTAGNCRTLISNATVTCSWAYESTSAEGFHNDTEVVGSTAKLSSFYFRPGGSGGLGTIFAHDGATLEGRSTTWLGSSGPIAVTVSNANLKAHQLIVGKTSAASGASSLRILGASSSLKLSFDYPYTDNDIFGTGGSSIFEIAQGAKVSPWADTSYTTVYVAPGMSSSGNAFVVSGAGTEYDAPIEQVTVGSAATAGNSVQVLSNATYVVKRMTIKGQNTFKVSDSTVNISHGDGYHTSLSVGGGTSAPDSQLVIAGAAPKINFTETVSHGGIKVYPGSKIVYELPAEPYAVVPFETFWLNVTYPEGSDQIGEIDIDVSKIPEKHERLKYKLATVIETKWLHQDVIDRVNNLDQVKAVKGRLAWQDNDLVFTVPGTMGLSVIVR